MVVDSPDSYAVGRRRGSSITVQELRRVLPLIAGTIWLVTLLDFARPGLFLFSGHLKGADFLHFYVLGTQARSHQFISDWSTFDAYQVRLLPISEGTHYPPVYPPQVAALFRPFASLGYLQALALWLGLSTVLYAFLVPRLRALLYPESPLRLVSLAAAAFPPFWITIEHGQLSVIALAGLTLFASALERRNAWLAGIGIGVLAYKPSLFAPAILFLAISGEWPMVVAAVVFGSIETVAGAMFVANDSLVGYTRILATLAQHADMLAAKPFQMHSLRAFWLTLVPPPWSAQLYLASAVVVWFAARNAWRHDRTVGFRAALLPLVVVLTSPHLYHYDLLILAPTFLYGARLIVRQGRKAGLFVVAFAGVFLAPGFAFLRVQLFVAVYLVMLWAWFLAGADRQRERTPPPDS